VRSQSLRDHPGQISLPGGRVDSGDVAQDASHAYRESA
jgi:ADP-ribose pyrophosphatase YjhB (NUDIX family)